MDKIVRSLPSANNHEIEINYRAGKRPKIWFGKTPMNLSSYDSVTLWLAEIRMIVVLILLVFTFFWFTCSEQFKIFIRTDQLLFPLWICYLIFWFILTPIYAFIISRTPKLMEKFINIPFITSFKRKLFVLPKDVKGEYVVIPSFENKGLDYHCEGDFADYLDKVEIKMFQYRKHLLFKSRRISMFKKIKFKKNKKHKLKNLKKDAFNYWAAFHFSKKPKKGFMKVVYA